uniref:Uncharacterized protein n=1 Tax=Arundo donax TaxID=35708 RepID=A0A0A8ZV96_ARUDO
MRGTYIDKYTIGMSI